jgi:hypothetical protein
VRIRCVGRPGKCVRVARVLRWQEVPVLVEQELSGGPAALGLNPLEGRAPSHVQTGPGVAQAVRCESTVGAEGVGDQGLPDAHTEGAEVDVAAPTVREHQSGAIAIVRSGSAQHFGKAGR